MTKIWMINTRVSGMIHYNEQQPPADAPCIRVHRLSLFSENRESISVLVR